MHTRTYMSPEEKIQAAEEYPGGTGCLNQTAKKWEVHRGTFQKQLLNYEMFGEESLYPRRENQYYSETLKRQAVELYLSGQASEGEVCKKYRIRSRQELQLDGSTLRPNLPASLRIGTQISCRRQGSLQKRRKALICKG